MLRILTALALAFMPAAASATDFTTGTLWNPETIALWTSSTPGIHYTKTLFGAGKTIELQNLPISGYVKQVELQVYGTEPAMLTFPRLNYSVVFTPELDVNSQKAVTIDLPQWVPFIAGTDTPTVESAGALRFVGLSPPQSNPGMFVDYALAAGDKKTQWHIGLVYTVELIEADTNGDGRIDFFDFGTLKSDFGTSNPASDFDRSGLVDLADFGLLKSNFGHDIRTEGAAPVPEPAGWVLLGVGAVLVLGFWASAR